MLNFFIFYCALELEAIKVSLRGLVSAGSDKASTATGGGRTEASKTKVKASPKAMLEVSGVSAVGVKLVRLSNTFNNPVGIVLAQYFCSQVRWSKKGARRRLGPQPQMIALLQVSDRRLVLRCCL